MELTELMDLKNDQQTIPKGCWGRIDGVDRLELISFDCKFQCWLYFIVKVLLIGGHGGSIVGSFNQQKFSPVSCHSVHTLYTHHFLSDSAPAFLKEG